jgi:hypothetical protein
MNARDLHRALDRAFSEAMARDNRIARNHGSGLSCDRTSVRASSVCDARKLSQIGESFPDLARPIRFRRRNLMMSDAPLIRAAKLWRKKSERNGRDYFVGRLGGCRVLILENNDAAAEGEERNSHWLLLGQADDKPRENRGGGSGARR